MTVLIIFESVEGQTTKIVRFVEDLLQKAGVKVRVADTSDKMLSISFDTVERVVLAAPVHERRHPPSFELFLSAEKDTLAKFQTLMLSVSLKAAFADGIEEAEDFLTEMEMRTGFCATQTCLVAGAVRRSSYDYFASQVLQHVVLAGQDPHLGLEDQEFTDWSALETVFADFAKAG